MWVFRRVGIWVSAWMGISIECVFGRMMRMLLRSASRWQVLRVSLRSPIRSILLLFPMLPRLDRRSPLPARLTAPPSSVQALAVVT